MTCARQRQVFGCDRSGLVPRTVGGMRQRAGFAGAPVSDPASDETALIWVNVSLARLRQSKDMLNPGARLAIGPEVLDRIIVALAGRGYRVIGPVVRDGAIVYDTLTRLDELPAGWTDRQDGGRYRLERRGDMAYFGYAVGPHSWKRFLHPPVERLWQARRDGDGFTAVEHDPPAERLAFIGVRACELGAIAIQDRVFLGGQYRDRTYRIRREQAFIIAVDCGEAGGTCFCASMGTGPKAGSGFDLALTELVDDDRHLFLIEVGTAAGGNLIADLPHRPASTAETAAGSIPTASRSCCRPTRTIRAGTRSPSAVSPAATARWSVPPVFAQRSRTRPICPATRPNACATGIPALPLISPTCTAAACAPRRAGATASG